MPLYDIECIDCKNKFEIELPMGSPLPQCPSCNSNKTERLLTPPPVIFKGEGFYKTDSVQNPKTAENAKDSVKKQETEKKPDTAENATKGKTEMKTEPTKEQKTKAQ